MNVTNLSPATAIAALALSAPETLSVTSRTRMLTAAELHQEIGRLASVLAAGGVRPGDRVAHVGRNSPTMLSTFLACAWLGAVAVPLGFRLAPSELGAVLTHCGAHTVVIGADVIVTAQPVAGSLNVHRWIVDDRDCSADVPVPPGWESLTTLDAAVETADREPLPRTTDDLATLLYTSGTTGHPKGVMLTHGNLLWSTRNMDSVIETSPHDVTLAVAPMFHVGGLNALTLSTLTGGGTVVVRATFDPRATLMDLHDEGITSIFGVPAMYAAMARCPEFASADLSAVRVAIAAGSLVPDALIATYLRQGIRLQTSWGMTETAPAVTCVPRNLTAARPGSAGRPLPHTEVRLRRPDGHTITEDGCTGEVTVRGPNVTPGYWDDPVATAAAISPDGWLRTGDLARWDDGFLTIVGRCTDMINTGGEKVYPAEVEQALVGLPGVTDVVVLGVPDETWGETVAVVLECAHPISSETVREFAATTIARYKLPRVLLCLTELPRTPVGKADRHRLRTMLIQNCVTHPPTLTVQRQ